MFPESLPGCFQKLWPNVSRTVGPMFQEFMAGYNRIYCPDEIRISGRMFSELLAGWGRISQSSVKKNWRAIGSYF
jgi:hypothetical protein